MSKAKVYLIPNFLGDDATIDRSFPKENREIIESISHFAVENLKDSRRFLIRLGLKSKIDQSEFYLLDKRSTKEEVSSILLALQSGNSVGIISDAGCPGVADPGSILVAEAHRQGFTVVPLIGPSSILLALMASGFNGQSFAFKGYLHREKAIRSKELKAMETLSKKEGQTQIFMETPYRNEAMWADLMQVLHPDTKLCVAANLTCPNEFIRSTSILEWRKNKKENLNKIPIIFVLSA